MLTKISKGLQVTLPADVRKRFNLKAGSKVDIEVRKDKIIITPLEDMTLENVFKRADTFKRHNLSPEDLEKMEDGLY